MMRVSGSVAAYRLVDVGYVIDLKRAAEVLGPQTRGPALLYRAHSEGIEIRVPPLLVQLDARGLTVQSRAHPVEVTAHLFDFGVCSLRLTAQANDMTWEQYVEFGRAFDQSDAVRECLTTEIAALVERLRPAIDRPGTADEVEDYTVYRIDRLAREDGTRIDAQSLAPRDLIPLLSTESRALSPEAQYELVSRRFSYYADDLVVVTWDSALIVDPDRSDHDVEYVIEFANAQLLELRVYDGLLDEELPVLYDRIEERRRVPAITRRYRPLLAQLQTRVADVTEIVERADNGFKVVNDVYLARVYIAALEVFREQAWRRGIDRKLQIFRDTYSMLNAEAQAARGELLEIMIILLFVADIAISLLQ
jgi:hypothetical protein